MRRPRGRVVIVAALLLVVAAGLRVREVQLMTYRPVNDGAFYLMWASQVAHSGDYSTSHASGAGGDGSRGPSAYFPPGYPYLLAAVDLIDGRTGPDGAVHASQLTQVALGTATVALIGLIAYEAFGEVIALIAIGLAAVCPALIELTVVLAAENLFTALLLAAVWTMLRARRATHPLRWTAASGMLVGLATLTHVNGVVVVPPLAYAAWRVRRNPGATPKGRLAAPALLLAAAALTIAPWTIRNAVELHRFVAVSDETGFTLVGTYNPVSAADRAVPYQWSSYATLPQDRRLIAQTPQLTEPAVSGKLETQALDYIGRHPLAPLAAGYHNTLRLLDLEGSPAWHYSFNSIGLPVSTGRVAVIGFWILGVLALLGVFTRAARAAPRWLWLVAAFLWLSVVLVNAETPRFREPIDPFLILLAACGVASLGRRALALRASPPVGREGQRTAAGGELVTRASRR